MTRQQQWAKTALACVTAHRGQPEESKYRTLCMKAPMYLKQSGLVQTLAFLRSRDGDNGKRFVDDLARCYASATSTPRLTGDELQRQAQDADDLLKYLALSRDIQAVAVWFRRFAQSELGGNDEANPGEHA